MNTTGLKRNLYVMKAYFGDGSWFRAPISAVCVSDAKAKGVQMLKDTFGQIELMQRGLQKAEIKRIREAE